MKGVHPDTGPVYDIDSDEIEAFLRERITGKFALS